MSEAITITVGGATQFRLSQNDVTKQWRIEKRPPFKGWEPVIETVLMEMGGYTREMIFETKFFANRAMKRLERIERNKELIESSKWIPERKQNDQNE